METLIKKSYLYYEDINPTIVRYIHSDQVVLDVGCGYGALGEAIRSKGNYVIGLELEREAVEVAKKRLNEAIQLDIRDINTVKEKLSSKKFDVIVFADILEHLYDPGSMLTSYQGLLKPGGKIIISIPNVVVWNVRFSFLFGNFSYTDTGTCDWTHIRFFTLKSLRNLLKEAHLRIIKEDFNPGLIRPFVPLIKNCLSVYSKNSKSNPRAILDSPLYKFYLNYIFSLEKCFCQLSKGLFAFQFIFVTNKKE